MNADAASKSSAAAGRGQTIPVMNASTTSREIFPILYTPFQLASGGFQSASGGGSGLSERHFPAKRTSWAAQEVVGLDHRRPVQDWGHPCRPTSKSDRPDAQRPGEDRQGQRSAEARRDPGHA